MRTYSGNKGPPIRQMAERRNTALSYTLSRPVGTSKYKLPEIANTVYTGVFPGKKAFTVDVGL